MSLIKSISFCIALCSIAGGPSLASTFSSSYNSQASISYDDQDSGVKDTSLDNEAPESDLNAKLADAPNNQQRTDLAGISLADLGDDQLEVVAEEGHAPESYVSQSKGRAPIYEITVGDL